jgi:rRNA maturation RNase YbeY
VTARKRPSAPRLQLEVVDRGRPRSDRTFVRRVVRETLRYVDRLDLPVSLLLTDDDEIAAIHGEHLDDPTPTDVISFDYDDGAELVVSVDTARRVAKQHGHTIKAEVALYIVHGLLHCCGFDDIKPRDRKRMRVAEREVMQRLALSVHAVDADE